MNTIPIKKQTIEIKDYIGVFDNFLDDSTCDEMVKWFKDKESFEQVYTRIKTEGMTQEMKNDVATDINENNFYTLFDKPGKFSIAMNNVFNLYNERTNIMKYMHLDELHWDPFKIQKTSPAQGYHVWHTEQTPSDYQSAFRVLVFTTYLNDIEEGGETEFLLQSQRVSPVKGRICIFPSFFPYVHRGNAPLKEDKYIATGWLSGSPLTLQK